MEIDGDGDRNGDEGIGVKGTSMAGSSMIVGLPLNPKLESNLNQLFNW